MRTVVHWDGDRFFASIEQAADRRLRGRPLVIGGERRGIVLSASAEARRLGIRPGWPVGKARRAVPALVVLPAHYDLYERFFDQILALCRETTPLVEPAQVGAAWLDLTGAERINGQDAAHVIARIRATVHEWLRVSISAGLATNKLVARIAARMRKPGGQVAVPPGGERAFLAPLPLRALPGIEAGALEALQVAGLHTIGQFACAPVDALSTVLGRSALPLVRRAQGVSEEPVGRKRAAEPGWVEVVEFPNDVWEEAVLLAQLRRMLEALMTQVRAGGAEVRRVTLELRYTDREESRRAADLPEPTALESDLFHMLPGLLEDAWRRRVRIRAVALKAGRIYRPSSQLDLFSAASPRREYDLRLASVVDRLRRQHGRAIVRRGDELCKQAG
ncbi:MAG: DNA polymerase IV [Candidatus Solibacter usitatus]|nr:DNA polymerase IV [Candidatus Solibacter usitatus]